MTCMVVGKTYIRIFRLPMPPHNILAKCEALATPPSKKTLWRNITTEKASLQKKRCTIASMDDMLN
jgi:hypothetical protein